jgi:hypothetical protein
MLYTKDHRKKGDKMASHEIKLRILLFEEENIWIAQCLENDIATQGALIKDAINAMERTILGQIALDVQDGIKPLSEIAPAPSSYFEMFDKAYRLCDKSKFTAPHKMLSRPILAETAIADVVPIGA